MKILDFRWFNGRSYVGIIKVEDEYDGTKYYIGSPPGGVYGMSLEAEDVKWIADWGAKFPKEAGDLLFGVN